jgi:hypothetical protein
MNDSGGIAPKATVTVSIILIGVALLIFGACASSRGWTKAGAVETDFNRDSYECAREATYSRARAGAGMFREDAAGRDLYRACMRARGYELVEGGRWRGFRD